MDEESVSTSDLEGEEKEDDSKIDCDESELSLSDDELVRGMNDKFILPELGFLYGFINFPQQ